MNGNDHLAGLGTVAAFAAIGAAFGLAYFAALRVNARLYLAGTGLGPPFALHVARLAAAALLFWVSARQGAAPLLAALAGFLVARLIAVRPARRLP